jgi:hypothetical protein
MVSYFGVKSNPRIILKFKVQNEREQKESCLGVSCLFNPQRQQRRCAASVSLKEELSVETGQKLRPDNGGGAPQRGQRFNFSSNFVPQ